MKKLLLLAVCGLFLCETSALAQGTDKCGLPKFKEKLIQNDPSAAAALRQFDREIADRTAAYAAANQNTSKKTTDEVLIPVIFHVVVSAAKTTQLGGTAGIIGRVTTQMEVINQDYNRGNADSTLIPAAFKPLYGNVGIKFGLAHTAPDGSSTPGYEIVTATAESFDINSGIFASDAKHAVNGGADAWDATKYLNIWVVNLTDNGNPSNILGFSFAPSFVNPPYNIPQSEIGILLNYGAFGKRTSATQYFISGIDKGRTLTHELGHFFDLIHIWGDDGGACPGQAGGFDDDITDTPPQADQNFGAPFFPKLDACTPTGNGVMFMNYMDYTNDAKMQMFTMGQITRMTASIQSGTEGYSVTQHPELTQYPLAVSGIEKEIGMSVSPNPSMGPVNVSFSDPKGLQDINVINMTGQTVYHIGTNDQPIANYNIDLTGMSKGLYLIQCNFASGTVTRKIVVQ